MIRATLFALCTALCPMASSAITIDLDFDDVPDFFDGFLDDGDQATGGPVTVTFSNITAANGNSFADVDQDGIYFSNTPDPVFPQVFNDVVTMDITFDRAVRLVSYDVDFTETQVGGFTISGINGTSGFNDLTTLGDFAFDAGTIPFFLAGEAYTFTHTVTGLFSPDPLFDFQVPFFSQIDEFEVALVPLSATLPLSLLGLGGLALLRRRRQGADACKT